MKHKRIRGFTLVEVAVVVAVIAILASLSILAFNKVQAQAYDASQRTLIIAIMTTFDKYYDKYGEYPTGCSLSTVASGCRANQSTVTTTSTAIYSNTTSSTIASMPGLESLGTVLGNTSTTPINGTYLTYGVYYWGQLGQYPNAGCGTGCSSGVSITSPGGGMACNSTDTIYKIAGDTPSSYSSYTLAYHSKEDGRWHIYQGKYGQRLKFIPGNYITAGTAIGKCVFEN